MASTFANKLMSFRTCFRVDTYKVQNWERINSIRMGVKPYIYTLQSNDATSAFTKFENTIKHLIITISKSKYFFFFFFLKDCLAGAKTSSTIGIIGALPIVTA